MSICLEKLPHSCGTKTGLQVFLHENNKIDGYCFKCRKPVPDPYGGTVDASKIPVVKKKTPEEVKESLEEIKEYPTVDIPERKLRSSTLSFFEAKTSLSEEDGVSPTAIFWPITSNGVLTGYHVKTLGHHKFVYNVGETKGGDLIGWAQATKHGGWKLIITEGPEDMASVYRFYEMYEKNSSYFPAVVSLPRGAGSAKAVITKHLADIKSIFKEVVLCFDNDQAGQEAVKEVIKILPSAKSVILPYKDANECLQEGAAKAAYERLSFRAATPKNTRLIHAHDLHDLAKQPAEFGQFSWPWEGLNDAMRGIRTKETIYIGGAPKIGKSTVKNSLAAHFIKNDKAKVFMACPEEPNITTYKLVANQLTGKIFHDPKIPFDEDAYEEAGEIIKDNLTMVDLYQFLGWESLKEDIKASVNEGTKIVMIDPITSLTNGINSAEANTMLQSFTQELSAMAKDMDFVAFLFCHLKAAEGQISEDKRDAYYKKEKYMDLGPISHSWGGSVYSDQFTGSRAMQRACHLMLGIMGNKDPDLSEEIRNTRELIILEDRNWGNTAKYPLYYNKNTGQFMEL